MARKLVNALAMTKREKEPSIQPALFATGRFPTWEHVRRIMREKLPRGGRQALADYLGVTASTVSEMLGEGSQPSYRRVVECIQYLEANSLHRFE